MAKCFFSFSLDFLSTYSEFLKDQNCQGSYPQFNPDLEGKQLLSAVELETFKQRHKIDLAKLLHNSFKVTELISIFQKCLIFLQ